MLWLPQKRSLLIDPRPLVKLCDLQSSVADLTTYTFTNVNVGDLGSTSSTNPGSVSDLLGTNAHVRIKSKKVFFVIVHAEDAAATFGITSVSMGGVALQEQVDRGGVTNAINTGFYALGTANLRDMVGTDVVVVMTEAVTSCAIAVLSVENLGLCEGLNNKNGTGTTEVTLAPDCNAENLNTFEFGLYASTLAATGQTCIWRSPPLSGAVAPMLLYDEANAEMSYSAAWNYSPGYNGNNVNTCGVICDWSGATAFDVVGSLYR